MILILHISDLHFVNNAASYNFREVLFLEAAGKVKKVPRGKKLLIVTGDFHNFEDKDYQEAEEFLKKLVSYMDLDIKQDVYVIPGNHDVGNDTALEPILKKTDKNWKSHQESCLEMLKKGKTSYINERLQKFRPYSVFVQNLGVYESVQGVDYPASSHVRRWRDKLNILHLNTALIADGKKKDGQMTDADTAAYSKTWEPYYDAKIPSIAIGHNSFYDIKESQRHDLAGTFALRNVSAYLCGDRHQIERNPEYRKITIQPEQKHDIEIPNLVAAKSIADGDDNYSEVGFCWHYWDEKSDEVSVEFRKWTSFSRGKTELDGEGRRYDMRHDPPDKPDPIWKPDDGSVNVDPPIPEDSDTRLRKYLTEVLEQKRKSHPSFQLLEVDEIDSRLYPNIKEYSQIEPWGRIPVNSNDLSGDSCPIWETIRGTWSAPEHRSIVILGEGGIGKTVALFSIADAPDGTMPVPALYIPMYELVDIDGQLLELEEYIAKRYRRYSDSIDTLATESWDDVPKLLILLDGFNEISFSLRRRALDVVNEWYDSHPGAQVIAVSRPMDGLNLEQELAGNPLPIELTPLKEDTVRIYLQEVHRKIPPSEASIWKDLQYPLFLNLYVKNRGLTKKLPAGYPLSIKNADNGGALIWNFLQRELLRHKADKSEKAENWVLRCAVANEYFLPHIAYRMVSEHRMEISYKQADLWIKEAVDQFDGRKLPKHLRMIWDKYEQNHGKAPKVDMFSFDVWRDTVLRDSGILISHVEQIIETGELRNNYVFMHQHFRDCLAGLYLVNQAETTEEKELPEVWKHSQNHLALDYAAELMDSGTAEKLWEINRMQMQYDSPDYVDDHSGTFSLLELQRRRKPVPENLDFSGMDIRGISLACYMARGVDALPLFRNSLYSCDTKMELSTFQKEGHNSNINCIQALPDGRFVSGSLSSFLCVWDPSFGRCVQTLKGHSGHINCLALLSDGRLVSGSYDRSLRIWNTSDGQCIQTLEGHFDWITCVSGLSYDRCVSGSADGSLRVWNTLDGRCLQTLEGHFGKITCVTVLSDDLIVSGSEDGFLRVWNPLDGRCLQKLEGHQAGVTCVAVLSDGRCVSGSVDSSLRVWNPLDGRCLQALEGHQACVTCVEVFLDGLIVSGSYDGSLRIWNSSDGECLQILGANNIWDMYMAILPDSRIAICSSDSSLRVWDSSNGKCLKFMGWSYSPITCLSVLQDGRFVSGTYDGFLRIWDASDGRYLQIRGGHSSQISCMTVLYDSRLVSGAYDGSLCVWNPSDGRCLQILQGHSDGVTCLAVLPDGRLVSGSYDRSLRIWNPSDGRCLQILDGHSSWIRCVAALSDGRIVSGAYCSSLRDGSLRMWDSSDSRCLQILEGYSGQISCMAVFDGRLVSGAYDGSLYVWDFLNGRGLYSLEGHSDVVTCLAVLPDGRLVSAANDGFVKIWNLDTGECTEIMDRTDVEVSKMDLSYAILTKELARLLWQNGATISEADIEKYIRKSC